MGATNTIDVSSYQKLSFDPVTLSSKYGITKISMKFTQGANYLNPYAQQQYQMTVNAGLVPCPYHYTVAANYAQAYEEAQYFIKYLLAYGVSKNTPIMLDLEDPTYIPQSANSITNISNGWSDALKSAGYSNQILYMSASWFSNYYTSSNAIKKTWVAQYLNTQYYGTAEPTLSYRPNNCNVWQFSSTWGKVFPSAYWGGNGLDVSHDYDNTISYANSQETTTTQPIKKESIYKMFDTFLPDDKGVLTFFEDTNIPNVDDPSKGTAFAKGSSWRVKGIDSNNGYILSPSSHAIPSSNAKFYFQPSPYDPENYKTAKGKVVQVNDSVNKAHLYAKPTEDLSKNYATIGIEKEDGSKDSIPWELDNKTAYLVGEPIEQYGTVWLQVATNAYLNLKDVVFKV